MSDWAEVWTWTYYGSGASIQMGRMENAPKYAFRDPQNEKKDSGKRIHSIDKGDTPPNG